MTLTVRTTRHGPVIADPGGGEVLALAATWLQGEDRTPQALWDASHAHDWDAFRNAFKNAVAPEQNVTYADVDGHIGFIAPATVPIRAQGDGMAPVPGWTGENEWTGTVPFDGLPQGVDPPSGRFVAANNKIVPDSYPYMITKNWELPYRAQRITELLDATPMQSPDTAATMQADIDSTAARQLLPLMLVGTPQSAAGQETIRRLRAWDQRMSRDRVEPLLFIAWLREFNRQILADKLGPLFDNYWALHPDVIQNILTSHPDWCDNRETREVETCPQQLGAALDRAIDGLTQRYGGDISSWHWGDVHPASFCASDLVAAAGDRRLARRRHSGRWQFRYDRQCHHVRRRRGAALHRGPRHVDAHDRRYGRSGGRAVHDRSRPVGQSALITLQRPAIGLARCRLCASSATMRAAACSPWHRINQTLSWWRQRLEY